MITWLIMHWSCGWWYTDHVADQALITWLIVLWTRSWKYTDHETACTDHLTAHALVTWMIIRWSLDCLCTKKMADHALITWLRMNWSRGCHTLMKWQIMPWSVDWSCTDHVVYLTSARSIYSHCAPSCLLELIIRICFLCILPFPSYLTMGLLHRPFLYFTFFICKSGFNSICLKRAYMRMNWFDIH